MDTSQASRPYGTPTNSSLGLFRVGVVATVSRKPKHISPSATSGKKPLQSRDKHPTSLEQHHFMRARLRKFARLGRFLPAVKYSMPTLRRK